MEEIRKAYDEVEEVSKELLFRNDCYALYKTFEFVYEKI